MADKRETPEAQGERSRRKRTAPTIDLTATEVAMPDTSPGQAATPSPSAQAEPTGQTPFESAPDPQPKPDDPAQAAAAEEPPSASSPPPTDPEYPGHTATPHAGAGSALTAAIVGGLIGAVIIAALGAGLWFSGSIPSRNARLLKNTGQRVASLEKQVNDLQNRPPPKVDTRQLDKSIAALTQRVSTVENRIAHAPATQSDAAQQVAKIEKQVAALSSQVSALNKRSDQLSAAAQQAQQGVAAAQKAVGGLRQNVQSAVENQPPSITPAQFAALQKRLGTLDQSLGKLNAAVASNRSDFNKVQSEAKAAQTKVAQVAAAGRTTRLALSATSLRDAVLSGAPFGAELAQAKSLAPDPKMLVSLDRFAQRGVPTKDRLAAELRKMIPELRKAAGSQTSSGSFLDRLQANASRLVRITPVAPPSGNDVADVLSRLQHEAARADIGAAVADLAKLPDKARAPAQSWIAEVKAREAALATARQFAAQSARALGKG